MSKFFWIVCGLWCGIGGTFSLWLNLRKAVAEGALPRDEVARFCLAMSLWALLPCLVLWTLQLSLAGESTPFFLKWPTPQRYFALALQAFVWTALLYWVFLRDGAATLSRYRNATSKTPGFLSSPIAFKMAAVAAVASGILALVSAGG